jgi:hypothetical protein
VLFERPEGLGLSPIGMSLVMSDLGIANPEGPGLSWAAIITKNTIHTTTPMMANGSGWLSFQSKRPIQEFGHAQVNQSWP